MKKSLLGLDNELLELGAIDRKRKIGTYAKNKKHIQNYRVRNGMFKDKKNEMELLRKELMDNIATIPFLEFDVLIENDKVIKVDYKYFLTPKQVTFIEDHLANKTTIDQYAKFRSVRNKLATIQKKLPKTEEEEQNV